MCAIPKERTPGVSIIQPNSSESKVEDSGRAIAPEVVWRPLPVTSFTAPVTWCVDVLSDSAEFLCELDNKLFTKVDLPTPE